MAAANDCAQRVLGHPTQLHMPQVALQLGVRHIDTAAIYRNEASVRQGVRASGIPRSHVFITSKVRCACALGPSAW